MKINIRGVRGSIPTTGPETRNYGGNTSCNLVSDKGWVLVMDGGSGMQQLDLSKYLENRRVDILLTHLHLDHIQGLGFFKQLFDSRMDVHIWGPASSSQTLHSRLSRYLSPPLFPVLIRDLPCRLTLHEIENSHFGIGPFTIQSAYVIHPGPTVGYRISGGHSTFCYIPDHEPALGRNGMPSDPKWISGIDLAESADLLYHDAQYNEEEYKMKVGWGHSTMDVAARFAFIAGAKRLLLSHHDPSHSDAQLEEMLANLRSKTTYTFSYELAKEGMEIELS